MGTWLHLNCAFLPHSLASIHSFPQELSDTCPKETQQSALHVLLLLPALQRAGCPEQPQAYRRDAGEGAARPGGVLHARPLYHYHSLGPPGAPGWGCQPGRQWRSFCAVLTAAEPIQWRNYTSASTADANQPQSTLSLLKDASWLLAAQTDQSTELLVLYSHRL